MQIPSQEKIFKYLTGILGLAVLLLLVRELFFKPAQVDFPDLKYPIPEIDVKIDIFEEFNMQELTPFEQITPTALVGRDNPFEPYSLIEYQAALQELLISTTTIPIATTTIATTTKQ